jgi:tRNA (guanine37-N1)-methyltransferase
MRVDILTLFPGIFSGPLDNSILLRAREAGLLTVAVHDLRDFAAGKHRVTDEPPFGGGGGMVMKPEPVFAGVESVRERFGPGKAVLLSPQGETLSSALARRLSAEEDHLILICGRYEGVNQRVADHLADLEVSIGDYVLTGGELPALVLIDAVARFLPGVLGIPGLLPRFLRGGSARGAAVHPAAHVPRPRGAGRAPIGDHAAIEKWRREEALRRTRTRRPDLANKS